MKWLIMGILSIGHSYAVTLQVEYLARKFKLSFSNSLIDFSSRDMNISIAKKKCTEAMIKKFNKEIGMYLDKTASIEGKAIYYSIDENLKKESVFSEKGSYIISLPQEVKRLKLEEYLRCK